MIIYNYYRLLISKGHENKSEVGVSFKRLLLLTVGLYCMIFIAQTRVYIIAVLGAVTMLSLYDAGKSRKLLIYIGIILLAVISLSITGVLDNFWGGTFSTDSSNSLAYSTYYRLYEYKECMRYFGGDSPFIGKGLFISRYYTDRYASDSLYGSVIWANDVGVVGGF